MGSIDFWGALSAAFLLSFCVVGNLIFVGLAFGMWKGAEWSRNHARDGLQIAGTWLHKGKEQLELGESQVVAPFVRLRSNVTRVQTTVRRLRE